MKKIRVNILTIFPEQINNYLSVGILNQAVKKEFVDYNVVNLRDFTDNIHNNVDDIPYGGGPGMVIMAPVVIRALESLKNPGLKILLSPGGEMLNRTLAQKLSERDITLICGRYTGIDHRIMEFIDMELSIGDFILSGGELPALVVTESLVRLIPGVLGDEESLEEDRGYPVYTRPRDFRGLKVPDVLLSGNHKKIKEYRDQEARYGKIYRKTSKK